MANVFYGHLHRLDPARTGEKTPWRTLSIRQQLLCLHDKVMCSIIWSYFPSRLKKGDGGAGWGGLPSGLPRRYGSLLMVALYGEPDGGESFGKSNKPFTIHNPT